jgi:hypothetical protein
MKRPHQNAVQSERDLVMVAAKPVDQYRDATLTSLTAYSLFWLHRWQLPRTIEAIAILNWRLFPDKFAMVGFVEYPDAFRTNRSLLQMQPKYRNLLTGAATKGFSLNSRGMEIAEELTARIGPPTKGDGNLLGALVEVSSEASNPKGPARSIEPDRVIDSLRKSKLFEKWRDGILTDRDLIHVHALLGIFNHTPGPVRQRAMKELEQSAQKVGDAEAGRFLRDVRQAFPQALSP